MPPKHTPGPWIVAPKQYGTIYPGPGHKPVTYEKPHRDINQASDNSAIAEVHGNDEEAQENAELIADAPKLVRLVKQMYQHLAQIHEIEIDAGVCCDAPCVYCDLLRDAKAILRKHGYGPEPDAPEQERSNATNDRSANR